MFVDQTLSILWSFYYYITKIMYAASLIWALTTGKHEVLIHLLCMAAIFISAEMVCGLAQILAALLLDANGAKLKYLLFSPFYMLIYWRMNAFTIMTTFLPALRTILDFGVGTWKSPTRTKLGKA